MPPAPQNVPTWHSPTKAGWESYTSIDHLRSQCGRMDHITGQRAYVLVFWTWFLCLGLLDLTFSRLSILDLVFF